MRAKPPRIFVPPKTTVAMAFISTIDPANGSALFSFEVNITDAIAAHAPHST